MRIRDNRDLVFSRASRWGCALAMFAAACASDRGGTRPEVSSVSPDTVITANEQASITISGSGFAPAVEDALKDNPVVVMPRVLLGPPAGEAIPIPSANVSFPNGNTSGDTLIAVIPAGLAPPRQPNQPDVVYDIIVENPNGKRDVLEDALTITAPQVFDLLGIDPPFACTCTRTAVTITSDGEFVSTPTVQLRSTADDAAEAVALERVAFVSEDVITAVVPEGLDVGEYDVLVNNPASVGNTGLLEAGFRVVALPVPNIIAVVPGRGDTQDDTPASIFGENFRDPVDVELIAEDGEIVTTLDGVTPVGPGQIDVTFPTSSIALGAYLVRVTNTDEETFFTFSSFLVTNPPGNLNPFEQDSELVTARRLLAGASATDDLGNRYLYAIGGDTGEGGDVLDTIEVAQLSRFGDLSAWEVQPNTLNTPRKGASAVVVPVFGESEFVPTKTYIYVTGGVDDTGTVLDSVERALVLSSNQVPQIASIGLAEVDGDLAGGTWYYRVAAVLDAGDPDNPEGETLPSEEVTVTLPEAGGAVALDWEALEVNGTAAASYRVYRTDEANGVSGQEHLIAEVTDTEYTDTGASAGTEAPLGPGSTGVFVLDDSTMTTPRWGHGAVIAPDENGDRWLIAIGGKSAVDLAVLDSIERAPVDADASIGAFDSTGRISLAVPRAFHLALVETTDNVSSFEGPGSQLWVAGGITTDGSTISTVNFSEYSADGNGVWIPTDNNQRVTDKAGQMGLIVNDKMFVLGGADANDTTFSSVIAGGRDSTFGVETIGPSTEIGGRLISPFSSSANALLASRAFGVAASGAGFFYFIGGTSNGTNAVATTERTF